VLGLTSRLEKDDFLISCVDVEIDQLSELHERPNVIVPPASCVTMLLKPCDKLAALLDFEVPSTIDLAEGPQRAEIFARAHPPFLWHKGYRAGAVRVSTDEAGRIGGEGLLQQNVEGRLECLAFVANRGSLLTAISLSKDVITDLGKTWTGSVTECSEDLWHRLDHFVQETKWHGGGVIELVRQADGTAWLIDVNARFPAWVHGATICGHNLVGVLMMSVTGRRAMESPRTASTFTRLVLEFPWKDPAAPSIDQNATHVDG